MSNNIFSKIKELILEIDSSLTVTLESSMRNDLGLDSTDVISIVFELEDAFNIKISDSDLEENNLDVISDLVEYIKKRIKSK